MIGYTLGRYIFSRFLGTILGVFFIIFALIYLVDFIEMMRRAAGISEARVFSILWLCFLRTPTIAEQVFPFAVLGGGMLAFLTLTRRLELIVARAAGISIWQILVPPLACVLALGLFLIFIYNPVSSFLKAKADQMEAGLFGRKVISQTKAGMWLRQKSLDGQSILYASMASQEGTLLHEVTAFVFDPQGHFVERVDAAKAQLFPSYWQLEEARISALEEPTKLMRSYILPTILQPDQVMQSFLSPDSIPFWSLPKLIQRSESAGLDATAYRLRFQTLLAKPLLFAAMILVAACFSLRFSRMGGISSMILGGVIAGFVLYVFTKIVGDLGNAGLLAIPLAAWSPAALATFLATFSLLHQEDG